MQHDFDHEYGQARAACRRTGDVYENNFATITNLFYQLNSIRIVTQMWRTSRTPYDAVLYLRPDLLYNCPLPVHLLGSLAPDTWYVVNNHHFAGVNDRFLMARPAEAELWGNRLYFTLVTCTRSQVRSARGCLHSCCHLTARDRQGCSCAVLQKASNKHQYGSRILSAQGVGWVPCHACVDPRDRPQAWTLSAGVGAQTRCLDVTRVELSADIGSPCTMSIRKARLSREVGAKLHPPPTVCEPGCRRSIGR